VYRTRGLICALFTAVLAALLPLVASPAHASSTYLCTSYSGCRGEGYSHFGYAAASRQMWWRMFSGHNCTNYVAYRMVKGGMSAVRPWDGSGMAYNWGHVKRRITDDRPMVGAVAWWRRNVPGAGSSGHVAYVEKVLSGSKIVISEDSWSGDFHWRRISKSGSGWPSGFIHFNDRKVKVRSKPEITGRAAVGRALVASAGRWAVPSRHTYQWLADGRRIRGATSPRFTPGPRQLRSRLSVRVTAAHRGYVGGAATSERTARVDLGHLQTVSPPTITGTARVGEVLSAHAGTWSPRPSSTAIRWFAGREPIAGERGARLKLAPEQRGKRISVRITARKDGYRSSPVRSERTAQVAAGRFEITSSFTVTGHPRLGGRLSLEPGRFSPADASMTYTWLRNGRPVPGAVGSSYVPGLADVGERLSLRVHLRHRGYRDRTLIVPTDGRVTTRPSLAVWTRGLPGRAVVLVKVSAPGVRTPGGKVIVRIGDHRRVRYLGTEIVRPGRLVTTVRVQRR
jgi:surface antigen